MTDNKRQRVVVERVVFGLMIGAIAGLIYTGASIAFGWKLAGVVLVGVVLVWLIGAGVLSWVSRSMD